MLFYQTVIDPDPKTKYSVNYDNKEFLTTVMRQLDGSGIDYSYKIDHLKRHWIKLHIDKKKYEEFLVDFCIEFADLCD